MGICKSSNNSSTKNGNIHQIQSSETLKYTETMKVAIAQEIKFDRISEKTIQEEFTNYYEIGNHLGSGAYGIVREGIYLIKQFVRKHIKNLQ